MIKKMQNLLFSTVAVFLLLPTTHASEMLTMDDLDEAKRLLELRSDFRSKSNNIEHNSKLTTLDFFYWVTKTNGEHLNEYSLDIAILNLCQRKFAAEYEPGADPLMLAFGNLFFGDNINLFTPYTESIADTIQSKHKFATELANDGACKRFSKYPAKEYDFLYKNI